MSTGTPYGVPPFNEVVSVTVIPVAPDTRTATPSTSSSAHASTTPYTRPGEPACWGPKVHRARTSTGVGGEPGGGSFGRSTHSMGGACGLSRPDPAWVRL